MSIVSSFPRDADGKGRQKNKHVAFSGTMSDSDACLVRNVLVRHLVDSVPECFSPRFFQLRDIGDERIPTILMPRELFFLRYDVRGRKYLAEAAYAASGKRTSIRCDWPHRDVPPRSATLPQPATAREDGFDSFLLNGSNRENVRFFRNTLGLFSSTIPLKGPSGSEKTRLLRAACRQLKERFHDSVVLLSDRVPRAAGNIAALLRPSQQPCRAVLIDDLQFLESSASTRRMPAAFLATLSGQVLFLGTLFSDGTLIDELHDRRLSHLSLSLPAPDRDIRMRFTQMHMKRTGLPSHRDTALLPARRCLKLRHILGGLEHMRLRYEQSGSLPSPSEMNSILADSGPAMPEDADTILASVAESHGFISAQLMESKRKKESDPPRQIAMYLCRPLPGAYSPVLGRIFGGRNRGTIMYPIKKIKELKVMNKDVHIPLTKLTKQCMHDAPGGPARL